MATITFFADHSEEPVLWVPPQSEAFTVEVGEGVRVVRSRTVKNAVEGALLHIPFVFFLIVAILIMLSALLPSIGDEPGVSSDAVAQCDYRYLEAYTGDGTLYCMDEMMPYTLVLDSIEQGEENHIRETFEGSQTYEYRWHEERDLVVIGFLDEGRYDCVLFMPETSLPEQWSVSDLKVDDPESYFPSWCGEEASTAERNYTEGEDPFDGTWLFVLGEENPEEVIFRTKVVGLTSFYEEWMSPLWFPSDWGEDEGGVHLMGLIVVGPLLLLTLFIAGHRNQMVIFDTDEKKLTRKRNAKIPSPFKRVWRGLDVGRVRFDHLVRTREHSSGGGEDGPVHTWTTSHPGVDMMVPTDSGDIVAIFFEYGPNPHLHNFLILDLLDNLGVPQETYLVPEAETSPTEDVPREADDDEGGHSVEEDKKGETNSGAFWSFDGQNSEESP
jgi:hypothetical protein